MSVAGSKIQRPRLRAGLTMPRPALEQRVVQALGEQALVLLCAPGGCGKTALLARALEQLPAGQGSAWVTLDSGDDLHRLLQCLWQALEPYDLPWRTSPGGLATMAASQDPRQRQQAADTLVDALEACELSHGVIALDDLHHVDDGEVLDFLDRLLLRLGERWTLAITSRHEPALRLARLRAMGVLTELRAAELQFTREEALALLLPAGFEASAAEALHQRTMGWPAGLRLALGGARGSGPGTAIDRQAFDFLTAEVLQQLEPGLREFLLQTSVLRELDAPRCEVRWSGWTSSSPWSATTRARSSCTTCSATRCSTACNSSAATSGRPCWRAPPSTRPTSCVARPCCWPQAGMTRPPPPCAAAACA